MTNSAVSILNIPATKSGIEKLNQLLSELDDGIVHINGKELLKFPLTIRGSMGHGYCEQDVSTFTLMDNTTKETMHPPWNYECLSYQYKDWRVFCDFIGVELIPNFHSTQALLGKY